LSARKKGVVDLDAERLRGLEVDDDINTEKSALARSKIRKLRRVVM
jgi:hypothetical protein